ncbi:hypothetical protein K470DRAFT_222534 [Piedraia hortae CBS 480.64]|uniref:Methyltransferase type 11 domain-containing protein n=1 Tax=Piedraia hortae CBS 480.64 TaxID=1314780 RepID=A0A6A7BRI9_9PEZI|nr:hypothetical protein K470DRAFT_222534 [Piedraia hortae CBS 480.64]
MNPRNTLIEDAPQVSVRMACLDKFPSPSTDDFPTPRAADGFNELYDVSDSENVPIKLSNSVKKHLRSPVPSIAIPSPSKWPTIEKLRAGEIASPLVDGILLSPNVLKRLHQPMPSPSVAPSLDGSATSEELLSSSCPSTPEPNENETGPNWDPPARLDPSAISILQRISGETSRPKSEMRQTTRPRLSTEGLSHKYDIPSALSVPSPHTFFASLKVKGWEQTPTTTVASQFYSLPFAKSEPDLPTSTALSFYSVPWAKTPVTAKRITEEIDETYETTLKQTAEANIERTQSWLRAQDSYMQALVEEDLPSAERADVDVPPSRISPIHDGTFWEGWQHIKRSQRARDVFLSRQARADAQHVRRTSCSQQHRQQLQGSFSISKAKEPMNLTAFERGVTPDEYGLSVEKARRQQEAFEQMEPSSWAVSAQRTVQGGKLLTSPVVESFRQRANVCILDVNGQVNCGWAWEIAADHPRANVFTTVGSDAEAHVAASSIEGPPNHFVAVANRPWELPFSDNSFDIISARSLHRDLKTTRPDGYAADEWDLCLQECRRVLKPGGYLEFSLLDAELCHADPTGQAIGVEFAFALRTLGYDANAGRSFLPRLKRAGFTDIKRAWMLYPTAEASLIARRGGHGSTADVRAMTGLVGARMWEEWMVKLERETGRDWLKDAANAMEGGGNWRCLLGWAKK